MKQYVGIGLDKGSKCGQAVIKASHDIISKMHGRDTWSHWIYSVQYKMHGVCITKNTYWTYVHIYEVKFNSKILQAT